jgi:tetratricopeptide (TPR) repeat protein/CBS domain-containing protein
MGAAFAGIVRVPLTSVIMIFEITRDYSIIVPLMIANLISYFISSRLQEEPIYEALQHQDGIRLPTGARAREALLTVAHAYRQGAGAVEDGDPRLHPDDPLEMAMRRLADGRVKALPVVSRTNVGEVIGTVSLEDVLSAYALGDSRLPEDATAPAAGSRLMTGLLAAVVGVAVLGGFLSYFYRAERTKRADQAYEEGKALVARQRLPEAIEQYRYALSISHRSDHRLALAVTLVQADRMNEASIYLREILREQPNSGPANRAMAAALAAQGRAQDAAVYYRRALLGSWPDRPEENRFRTRTELAQLLRKSGRQTEARAEMAALAADPPRDPALQKQAGVLLIDFGLWPEAAELYRDMLETGAPDAVEYDGLGEALYRQGDYQAADRAFRRALGIDPADTKAARRAEISEKVLALDPSRRGLRAQERFRRSEEVLRSAVGLTAACGIVDEEAAADVKLALARKSPPRSFSDAADANVALAERIWSKRPPSCQIPEDDPARIILTRLAAAR